MNVANYYRDDGVANGYDDGYAVTGITSTSPTQDYLTDVGAYTFADSYYGTFDQGGNVWEWNESLFSGVNRGRRGAYWGDSAGFNRSSALHIQPSCVTPG